jgi:hypothetical protein
MLGQGHYYCRRCGHAVYASRGGCGTCGTSLASLMLFDDAMSGGFIDRGMYDGGGIGFDPFDGEPVFNIPGTGIGIEPDGEVDLNVGGFDVPMDGGGFGGW